MTAAPLHAPSLCIALLGKLLTEQMGFVDQTRRWARRIKRDALTLWFAKSHPAVPWYAKALAVFIVAYALSPIDLIPDFIPVLGYVDDVILLPVLIWMAVRLLPPAVLADSRCKAERWIETHRRRPQSICGAVAIVVIWTLALVAMSVWVASAVVH